MTHKEAKQRYFDKVYKNAPLIDCACGCGEKIKAKDKYGRGVAYINGHNNRKYEDPTQFKREWNKRHVLERYNYKAERSRKLKGNLIKTKGGKCIICGYFYDGTNAAAFDFHHRHDTEKLFPVGVNSFTNFSLKKNYAEAEKCDLLCAICHRLHHSSVY